MNTPTSFFKIVKIDLKGDSSYYKGYSYCDSQRWTFGGKVYQKSGYGVALKHAREHRDKIYPGHKVGVIEFHVTALDQYKVQPE